MSLEWLDEQLRAPGVEMRQMLGMQAYLVGGRLFAAAGAPGLLLKLPPDVRRPLLESGDASDFVMGPGSSFGEWIALPQGVWEGHPERALELARLSLEYVRTAPPPPKPPREERRYRKRQY